MRYARVDTQAARAGAQGDEDVVRILPEYLPAKAQNGASALFNAMVAPLTQYAVRAALWYQGEANADQGLRWNQSYSADYYACMMGGMAAVVPSRGGWGGSQPPISDAVPARVIASDAGAVSIPSIATDPAIRATPAIAIPPSLPLMTPKGQSSAVLPGTGLPPGTDACTMTVQQAGMQQQHAAMYHQHQMYQMQQAGMVSGMPGMMGVSDTLYNSHAV